MVRKGSHQKALQPQQKPQHPLRLLFQLHQRLILLRRRRQQRALPVLQSLLTKHSSPLVVKPTDFGSGQAAPTEADASVPPKERTPAADKAPALPRSARQSPSSIQQEASKSGTFYRLLQRQLRGQARHSRRWRQALCGNIRDNCELSRCGQPGRRDWHGACASGQAVFTCCGYVHPKPRNAAG
jgi:hypothetical protein